jgi:hypothetical protein
MNINLGPPEKCIHFSGKNMLQHFALAHIPVD